MGTGTGRVRAHFCMDVTLFNNLHHTYFSDPARYHAYLYICDERHPMSAVLSICISSRSYFCTTALNSTRRSNAPHNLDLSWTIGQLDGWTISESWMNYGTIFYEYNV